MPSDVTLLLAEVADLRRRVAGTQFSGTVEEVQGDRVRVRWGYDAWNRPVLSPWLETDNHRGGARERRFYKRGQNVTISTIDGQLDEAATVAADAPNQSFPAPDQVDEAGAESETYQLGDLKVTKKSDSYEIWFKDRSKLRMLLRADGNIEIKASEKVFIETKQAHVKASERIYLETPLVEASKNVRVHGDVDVDGHVYAVGEVRARNRVNLSTHTHGGVESGPDRTSPP